MDAASLAAEFLDLSPRSSCYNPSQLFERGFRVRRPSLGAILLGLIPFAGACFSVPLWDRIHPIIFGLPFNFFWLILWLLITPLFMWGAYRLESAHDHEPGDSDEGGSS
jgi:uncharacterized protein DUF3311